MHNIPTIIQILTNLNCNLDCAYCYECKTNKVNDMPTISAYLRHKFKSSQNTQRTVELIGGESLMYPDIVEGIIERCYELTKEFGGRFVISLNTNGTLLGSAVIRTLLEKHKSVLHIGISVDGPKHAHDKYRKFNDGRGSYDTIIENLPWLLDTFKGRNGVKATFTVESCITSYAESIIHLIELGFTDIAGNIVYEDITTEGHVAGIYAQLKLIVDYLLANNLFDKVTLRKFTDIPDVYGLLKHEQRDAEYCGSCSNMSCLGFDGLVYGCNRFCTMDKQGMQIGVISEEEIEITNQALIDTVTTTRHRLPDDCKLCRIKMLCPSCLAAPYEHEDPQAYLNEKHSCGWTQAYAMALFYLQDKLTNKE